MKEIKQKNKTSALATSFLALASLAAVFFLLFPSLKDFIGFTLYFAILSAGGFGILSSCKGLTKNTLIDGINSVLSGLSANFLLFALLRLIKSDASWSVYIVLLIGLIGMLSGRKNIKSSFPEFRLSDPMIALACLLAILSIFLISDNIYYLKDGILLHDRLHPTYELSIASGLDSMFPVPDRSYEGKAMQYHFGCPIIYYQLINSFGLEPLRLAYLLFPSFLLSLFVLYTNELSKPLKKIPHRFLFVVAIVYSNLSLNTDVLNWVKSITHLSIPTILAPPVFFMRMESMGSYGLGILMALSLYSLIRLEKRSFPAECIILLGIAFSKATFFVPLVAAYFVYSAVLYISLKSPAQTIKNAIIVIPGIICMLIFILDAHKHNLWTIFPGSLNVDGIFLKGRTMLLLLNIPISAIIAIILYFGIGFFYLFPEIRKRLKDIFSKRYQELSDPSFLYLLIILCSYGMAFFLCEVTESNQIQFLFPGYLFLSLLSYEYFLKKYSCKKYAIAALALLVFFNASSSIFLQEILPSLKEKGFGEGYANSPVTELKERMVEIVPEEGIGRFIRNDAPIPCYHSYDLLNGLVKLSESKEDGTFAYNKLYDFCENRDNVKWVESGFIMTAVSQKQTVIENYKYKGLLTEPDYCNRTFESIHFFYLITGKDSDISGLHGRFNDSKIPRYEDLSYYPYLRFFSSRNYYTYNQDFVDCIEKKISDYHQDNTEKTAVLKDYLKKYGIRYLLFQNGETPLPQYASSLGLVNTYESGKVSVYQVNMNQIPN